MRNYRPAGQTLFWKLYASGFESYLNNFERLRRLNGPQGNPSAGSGERR